MNKFAILTQVVLSLAAVTFAAGPASAQSTHEGPSVSIPAGDIKFNPTGVKNKGLELQAGGAYGNMATGKHGSFVKMPASYASVPHIHTEDYYAVVVKGVMANHAPDTKDVALPVGSYWFQKGGENHVTKCISKEDCVFFIVQPGPFDFAAK
jgi:hypothetical protein